VRISGALFLLFHLLPAAWVAATLGRPLPWLVGSLLLSFIILLWVAVDGDIWRRLSGVVASGTLGLLNAAFAVSYYFQDGGFNAAFFYHMDRHSLRVGHDEYGLLMYTCAAYLLCSAAWPLFLRKQKWVPRRGYVAAALLIGLGTFTPLFSLSVFMVDVLGGRTSNPFLVDVGSRPELQRLPTERVPRNIVLIYGESIEQLYFDREVFGDLLPQLTDLRDRALVFDNIRSVAGTTWTIAGLVASQCALPLVVNHSGNTSLASIDVPYPAQNCFADVLRAYDYETVYLNGAGLDFAGKGNFLRAHGYGQVLGRDELLPQLPDSEYHGGWGLFDDSLFDLAAKKLAELQSGDRPFLLTILTLDTHHPNGNPSASCRDFDGNDNAILDAVHCTDQVAGRFISEMIQGGGFPNTLIAFVSDHLALRNTAWDVLTEHKKRRRLTFFVLGSDIEPKVVDARGTAFDIAPTLLDLAGLPNYHEFNLGSSLLTGQDGFWFRNPREAGELARNTSFLGEELVLDRDVEFVLDGPSIRIGGRRFTANYAGYALHSKIYGIIFDDQRRFKGFTSAKTLESFENRVGDDFVLAVSKNPRFRERFGVGSSEARLYCYAGFPSRDGHVFELLERKVKLPVERIEALFEGS